MLKTLNFKQNNLIIFSELFVYFYRYSNKVCVMKYVGHFCVLLIVLLILDFTLCLKCLNKKKNIIIKR